MNRCSGHKGKCPEPYTREEILEGQLTEDLKSISLDDEALEWMKAALRQGHKNDMEFHTRNLERLNAENSRIELKLKTMYEDKLEGRITNEYFDQKSREYGIEKEKIAKAIQEHQKANKDYIDSGIEKLDRAKSAPTDFMAQTEEEKRNLLKYFMENASWKGGVLESRFKQPFDVLELSNSKSETKKPLKVGSKSFNEKWLPGLDSNTID